MSAAATQKQVGQLDWALVTGGARRLGRAISLGLCEAGFNVIVHANQSRAAARDVAGIVAKAGRRSAVEIANLRQGRALEAFAARVLKKYGPPKVIVLSAASFLRRRLAETTLREWDEVQALNFRAPVFLADRLGRAMRSNGGAIVLIADAAGMTPWPNYGAHSLAKAGVVAAVRLLAAELAPTVTVNAVSPGPVLFPDKYSVKQRRAAIERTLLKRAGTPEDVVKAVNYLACAAPYVTGAVLPVDGGRHLLGMA